MTGGAGDSRGACPQTCHLVAVVQRGRLCTGCRRILIAGEASKPQLFRARPCVYLCSKIRRNEADGNTPRCVIPSANNNKRHE